MAGDIGAAIIRDKYYGRVAELYDHRSGSPKWRAEDAAMQRFLDRIGSGSVLDIPVGTGRFLHAYKVRGMSAIGMDISPDMLAQARLKMPDADLRVGDIMEIDLPDKSVDVVTAVRILSWLTVPEVRLALAEVARVSRTWIVTGGGRSTERAEVTRATPNFALVDSALIDRDGRGDYEMVLMRRTDAPD